MEQDVFADYKRELIDKAERILWRSGCVQPPYDLGVIAERLSVGIKLVDLDGLEGYVERNDCRSTHRWTAYISLRSSRQRRRFTIGHELAHVVLMEGAQKGQYIGLTRYRLTGRILSDVQDPKEESLCNAFAAELLMPRSKICRMVSCRSLGPDTIVAISDIFDVSVQMAARRISELLNFRGFSCSCWDLSTPWPISKWQVGIPRISSDVRQNIERLVGKAAGPWLPVHEQWQRFGRDRATYDVRVQPFQRSRSALFLALRRSAHWARPESFGQPLGTQLTLW